MMVDPTLCPLCGESNTCAMAAGAESAEPCWCVAVPIPPSVLDQVPPAARGVACLCRRCATAVPSPLGGA